MTTTAEERPVVRIDYTAHDRQAAAHSTYADELLYGGAAGGGKSRFVRAEVLAFALEVPGSASIIFRRTFPDLNRAGGMIPMMREEVPRRLGTYNATEHIWTLRNGSTIELAHIGRDADVTKYQGAEYQLAVFDEGTQFTEYQYRYVLSRLRASGKIRDRLTQLGYRPRAIVTANPGGVGHGWVKSRWIDPHPPGRVWRPAPTLEDPNPGTRCFIPARVTDNPSIDEGYVDRLNRLPDDLRRMLRDGDWDVYQGQRFTSFRRAIHVIDPEDLPLSLGGIRRGMGVDYGLDAPFAALWGAQLADGLVVVYRELYQAGLTPAEQAAAIRDAEADGERDPARPIPIALDPSTWARNPHVKDTKGVGAIRVGDPDDDVPPPGSIAAAYRDVFGSSVVKAHNDRLAGVALLSDKLRVRPDGLPRILIYSTCRNLIRTLPNLPRDTRRPEDVDCFVAGTMIRTPTGARPVESLRVGDVVDTPMGPQRVIRAAPEARVPVARVEFSDGTVLVGTADHEVVTHTRGLVALRDLLFSDSVATWLTSQRTPGTPSSTEGSPTADSQDALTTSPPRGPSNDTADRRSTATSTRTRSARSLTAGTSTTPTTTPRTTPPPTSSSSTPPTTPATTLRTAAKICEQLRQRGWLPPKARPSAEQPPPRCVPTPQRLANRARIVASLSTPSPEACTAPASASSPIGAPSTSASARSAAPSSGARPPAGTSPRLAPTRVDGSYGAETVYALTVDGCGLYYANEVLVTNTHAEDHAYDAMRYLLAELEGKGPVGGDASPIPSAATRYTTTADTGPVTGGIGHTGF